MQTYNNSECIATPDEYLLAAICGIGARYLPEDIVYAMPRPDGTGFDVVRRKSLDILKFFETKASSIIDIAFKRSRISTLQTLLLITNYFEYCQSPEDNSRRWFVGGVVCCKNCFVTSTTRALTHLFCHHLLRLFGW
jgi:hypothetical protein